MDKQKMQVYASEACKRFNDEMNNIDVQAMFKGLVVPDSDLRVKGVYCKPFTNEWQLQIGDSNTGWQIRYIPAHNATDEEHIEEIKELLYRQNED